MSEILPPQILTKILVLLPAKTLYRFKCVSKHWNSLLSTPRFVSSYISHNSSSPPSWFILDRQIGLSPTESNLHSSPTHLQLAPLPCVSTFSIKPHIISPPGNPPVFDNQPEPAAVLQSSDGLLLCYVDTKRDPLKENRKPRKYPSQFYSYFRRDYTTQISLFVVNPLTKEWARIPTPVHPFDMTYCIAFTTRVDPDNPGSVGKFVIVEYQHIIPDNSAILMCFSSDTGRWVAKRANHVLGFHLFRPIWAFEFQGRLFWTFVSAGLIMWEDDPFSASETDTKANCRLIPLPPGCTLPKAEVETVLHRAIGPSGGHIQFLELRYDQKVAQGRYAVKLWRLEGTDTGVWKVLYKVETGDFLNYLWYHLSLTQPKVCFLHPFEEDTVVLQTGIYLFTYNVRTRRVESLGKSDFGDFLMFKLPLWPTSLPPRLYAAYAKEDGNDFFQVGKIAEAINHYSRSITLLPNAVAYANRAMAYLKLGQFTEAEDDCKHALNFDSNYFKAYVRRALVRKELGNFEGSLDDFEHALKLEPDNRETQKQYAEIKLLAGKRQAPTAESIGDGGGVSKASDMAVVF